MKNTQQFIVLLTMLFLSVNSIMASVVYSVPLKGKEHHIGSLLNWQTVIEQNSEVFIVEKSIDGIEYMVAGEVEATGNSADEKTYRFLDVGASNDKTYYRLRQMDNDGTASYSQTIIVKKRLSNNFMILAMTNTVTNGAFTISIDANIDTEIKYIVKNKDGEIISNLKKEITFGINEITVDVKEEEEGIYFVVLTIEDEREQVIIRKVNDDIQRKVNVASKKQANGG